MKQLLNKLPLTKIKIYIGRMLYLPVHLVFRKNERIVTRGKIRYSLDLTEGIDLSLFLFSSFQRHVCRNKFLKLPPDAVIFDVGANTGIMMLQFAESVPSGRVYAFEPTSYAFSRLNENLELNPELAKRIVAVQSFVSSVSNQKPDMKAYASWKVGGPMGRQRHKIHDGVEKPAAGVPAISLDDFYHQNDIKRADLLKIDTDGYELDVLKGARQLIGSFKPAVIFEIGIYLMNESGICFGDYVEFFDSFGYRLYDSKNCREITAQNYQRHVPAKATIDILALPDKPETAK